MLWLCTLKLSSSLALHVGGIALFFFFLFEMASLVHSGPPYLVDPLFPDSGFLSNLLQIKTLRF